MYTALNDHDDSSSRRFTERPIIRIVRAADAGRNAAGAADERPVAYKWIFGARRRPDRKLQYGFSLH